MAIPQTPSPLAVIVAARTYNAQWFAGATNESKIQAAINAAAADGAQYVFIPANMLPYNASLVTFNNAVQMIREAGNPDVYDILAYGATGDGVADDTAEVQAAVTASVGKGPVYVEVGKTFKLSSTILYSAGVTIEGKVGTAAIGKFVWAGASGGTMFAPASTTQGNEFVRFKRIELDGASLAGVGLDFHYVSHGEAEDCYIHNVSQGNGYGIWFFRDAAVGFAAYYNHVLRGKISNCTIGVIYDGVGATQTNGSNSNWVEHVDLLNNGTSVFQKYGNDLLILGNASEAPTVCHFEVAGAGCHILANRIENAGGSPTVPGIKVDATALSAAEAFNYYATFTNDPVVDNQTSGDHILRFSTFGSGVNGGTQGLAQLTVLQILGRIFGSGAVGGLLDLNGGNSTGGATGTVRFNRSTAAPANGDISQWFNGTSSVQARVDFAGRMRASALAESVQTLTDQATVATDCTLGGYCKLSAGASRTIGAPTNVVTMRLVYDILNNTGGAITTTWNAIFKLAGAWTDPGAGKRRIIEFIWDGTNWVEQRRSVADI